MSFFRLSPARSNAAFRRRVILALVAALVAYPRVLHAQFGFLDRIFGKMENLSLSGGPAWTGGDEGLYRDANPFGLGVRAGIWAGGAGCMNLTTAARAAGKCAADKLRQKQRTDKRNRCMLIATGRGQNAAALAAVKLTHQDPALDPSPAECAELLGLIKEAFEEETTVTSGTGTTTTRSTLKRPTDTGHSVRYAVTLGYGQLLGLAGSDGELEYTGGIEELPSIGLNVVFLSRRVSGSVGGRLGLNRLLGFRAFLPGVAPATTGTTYAGSATALYYGAAVGGGIQITNGAEFMVEAAYTLRNFRSIEWGQSGSTLPTTIVRRLPLKVFGVEFGARVKL